jgi:hypothetical protein
MLARLLVPQRRGLSLPDLPAQVSHRAPVRRDEKAQGRGHLDWMPGSIVTCRGEICRLCVECMVSVGWHGMKQRELKYSATPNAPDQKRAEKSA